MPKDVWPRLYATSVRRTWKIRYKNPKEKRRRKDKNVVKFFPKGLISGFKMLRRRNRCAKSGNLTAEVCRLNTPCFQFLHATMEQKTCGFTRLYVGFYNRRNITFWHSKRHIGAKNAVHFGRRHSASQIIDSHCINVLQIILHFTSCPTPENNNGRRFFPAAVAL